MRSIIGVKTQFTEQDVTFIKDNFYKMTNPQLAQALDMTLTVVRKKCYELGLKRMEMEYWTKEQVDYLIFNYKNIGDVELAEYFNTTWAKNKGWTKKHIEKKRRYLKLKRTPGEIEKIHTRNIEKGRFANAPQLAWANRYVAKEGEVREWETKRGYRFKVIKLKKGFVHYAPWLWEQHYGPIPKGMCVKTKDGSLNVVIDNLEIITRAEHGSRNSIKRTYLPIEIRQTQSLINKINKKIKENEKQNS